MRPAESFAGKNGVFAPLDDLTVEVRAGAEEAEIFSAHLLILEDEEIASAAFGRIDRETGAEGAWQSTIREAAAALRALDEPYQAERAGDVEAVGDQVLARLLGVEPAPSVSSAGVLVAADLSVAEIVEAWDIVPSGDGAPT